MNKYKATITAVVVAPSVEAAKQRILAGEWASALEPEVTAVLVGEEAAEYEAAHKVLK